ncbi:hypothetical protein C8Q80DRAFT_1210646, partial [Daedaleopsis nitida]
MPVLTFIDDTDASVKYSPPDQWVPYPPGEGINAHFLLQPNGSNSSVTLDFAGNGIQVFGIVVAEEYPTASYTIDGSPIPCTVPSQSFTPDPQFNVSLCSIHDISYESHSLIITNFNSTAFYLLDYFLIETPDPGPSGSGSAAMTAPTTSTSPGVPSDSPSRMNVGTIAGACVVGGMLSVLLFLAVLLCRRRRWRFSSVNLQPNGSAPVTQITPLPFNPSNTPTSAITPDLRTDFTDVARHPSIVPYPSEPPSYHSEGFVRPHPTFAPQTKGMSRSTRTVYTTNEPPPAYM